MLEKETIFWFCALSGSGLFLIQFILNLVGMDAETEDHSIQDFKFLSKQAITGFLMMFGWSGLAARYEFALSTPVAILVAITVGFITMLITAWIFNQVRKLKSTGTVFKLEEAIGKEATIYQRIPKGGSGKISLSLQDMTHEIDAISLNGEELDSFSQVQVIRKLDDKTVVVTPIK